MTEQTHHATPVVTRFAPSPTGYLHLGNVRTALLNWLFARRHHGRFLLRFEDTDQDRSGQQYMQAIRQDLQWLGLQWDGEVLFQSAHHRQHADALQRLAETGAAYRCFCSSQQLNLDRKLATSRGLPPRYAGRCRGMSDEEAAARAGHEPFVWRLAVHADAGEVMVPDLLRGDVRFACRDLDDPVIVRSDGSFTFLLPNAIDDAQDGITHVLRGDDHLTNSAYQVWLLQKLGHAVPQYCHHGLLLGADGGKLSKRSGSASVCELREQGLLPQALVQAMARLGHPNMPDAMDIATLIAHFDAASLSTTAVRWSDEAMWRWHDRLLHAMPAGELAERLQGFFPDVSLPRLREFAALVGGNLARIEQAGEYRRLLQPDAQIADAAILTEAGREFFEQALALWQNEDTADWAAWTQALKAATGRKGRALFMPLRLALTGAAHGPEMRAVVDFLGHEGVGLRLQDVIRRLEA